MSSLDILLTIFGCFVTVGLSINAYFLRGILQDLNEVKIKLAIINTQAESKEVRIFNSERDIRDIYERLNSIERNKK